MTGPCLPDEHLLPTLAEPVSWQPARLWSWLTREALALASVVSAAGVLLAWVTS